MSRNSTIRQAGMSFTKWPIIHQLFLLADSPTSSSSPTGTMGHPDKITPDVIEWILSDEGVVRRWEGFCARLGLGSYKERIDGDYEPRSVESSDDRERVDQLDSTRNFVGIH